MKTKRIWAALFVFFVGARVGTAADDPGRFARMQDMQDQANLGQVRDFAQRLVEHSYDVNEDGKVDEEDYAEVDYGYDLASGYADLLSEEEIKLLDQDSDAVITEADHAQALENVKKLMQMHPAAPAGTVSTPR